MRPLQGKLACITGSAKGLGKMTALALADLGCDVAVNYVTSEREADALVAKLEAREVKALAVRADIADSEQANRLIDTVESHWNASIDIMVNNAGPFVRERRMFTQYSPQEIDYLMHGNLLSVMKLDHRVLRGMAQKDWGRIIHFGFGHASEARGWPHRAVYAAAKVGLVSFTKTLAYEQAANGVTVNMICPGDIRGANKEKSIEDVSGLRDEEQPGVRPGSGEDVARVIAFLCLPQSDFITGNIIDVSGGFDPIRTLAETKLKS
ncbi:SDR family oxidoreductase [Paenibacillus koleovorans]|uniref:SDR family oxidoreductase n=1 Tax=Paenibacillus koleovorans TaxID=121608 RepID=UPI000FD8FBFB|nr:SDR family oxidoreductase [Paenibacillus koleovorans]